MKKIPSSSLVIYQTPSGALELRGDFKKETLWATQAQIAELFEIDRTVITKHIRNILKDAELSQKQVCAKFAHTAEDGKTYQVQFYNLDIILSVGYRTNSKRAIEFRKWATRTLREHITKGYTLNKKVIFKNYGQFLKNVSDIQALLPTHVVLDPKTILDLVKEYSMTWTNLDAYDKDKLVKTGATKKKIELAGKGCKKYKPSWIDRYHSPHC